MAYEVVQAVENGTDDYLGLAVIFGSAERSLPLMKKAFAKLYEQKGISAPKSPHCGLGTVKTNIGNLLKQFCYTGIYFFTLCLII